MAVSGGPDSVALLHLLHNLTLQLKIIGVYVDHGLRPSEIPYEINLVKGYCSQLNLAFETVSVDTHTQKQRQRTSLEEAARILRYQALEEMRVRYGAKAIAVAHTADDQAEELLIRLIRGTGRKGLSGMDIQRGRIMRPLLEETKADLLSYLEERNIPFCQDSSNQDRAFLRNRIRLDLLPYLEQHFNSSIRHNLLQLADILNKEEEVLDSLANEEFQKAVKKSGKEITLDINAFQQCHLAMQRRILEKICWLMATKPGFRQIEQLCHIIHHGDEGAETHLKKGLRTQKKGSQVIFSYPEGRKSFRGSAKVAPAKIYLEIPEPGAYPVEGTKMTLNIRLQENRPGQEHGKGLKLDADKIRFPLLLRTHLAGERFTPLGMEGSKKISRFLSDRKIPLAKRHAFPVLLSAENILALAGLEIDHRFRLRSTTKNILLIDWS